MYGNMYVIYVNMFFSIYVMGLCSKLLEASGFGVEDLSFEMCWAGFGVWGCRVVFRSRGLQSWAVD